MVGGRNKEIRRKGVINMVRRQRKGRSGDKRQMRETRKMCE